MKHLFQLLLATIWLMVVVVSCDNDDPPVELTGRVEFSFSIEDESTGGRLLDADQITKIVLSIEDADGDLVYDHESLTVSKFNDVYISQPLDLTVGDYKLTEYLLLDNSDQILYASPVEGSDNAYLVNDPLPILFTISADVTTQVTPEVLSTEDFTPEDFGYVTTSFNIVSTFNMLLSISIYNPSTENFELTEASLHVAASGETIFDDLMMDNTNVVTLNDDYLNYTFTIKKAGYQTHEQSFTRSELSDYEETPLVVTLSSENTGPIAISAGYQSSYVITSDGTLWATGRNDFGGLGDGTNSDRNTFTEVLNNVIAIEKRLAIKSDGTLWTTGYNGEGRIGDGTLVDKNSFVQVLTDVSQVHDGQTHSLALKSDGTLWATGWNGFGQLGDGTNTSQSTYVQVMSDVVDISGNQNSFALKSDGTLWATGINFNGQLGDGTTANRNTFTQVLSGVSTISAGEGHTLALKTDGTVWATGYNYSGQLGDGTNTNRNTFGQVTTGVSAISAGAFHSLILKTDGSVWVAGDNVYGELGDGTNTDKNVFVQVSNDVTAISGGARHSLILKSDGTYMAAGHNGYGELGNGSNTNTNTFVPISF